MDKDNRFFVKKQKNKTKKQQKKRFT